MITMELGSRDFWWKVNIFLNKSKSAVPQLLSGVEVLSSPFGKSKLFAEIISENSNLDGLENLLSFRSSRTIPKLHNLSVTPKMLKKVINTFNSSKGSGPYCIPLVALSNCAPKLLSSLIFLIMFKVILFFISLESLICEPCVQERQERFVAKNYCYVSRLCVKYQENL